MAVTRAELLVSLASIGLFGSVAEGLLDGAIALAPADNVAEIAVPASATAETNATKINELIAALVASGAMLAA